MKTVIKSGILLILSLTFQVITAQYASISPYKGITSGKKTAKVDFTEWSTLLRRNTSVLGTIDYSSFKKDQNKFDRFIKILINTKITNNWTQDEQKAYWLNVYNVFSIKLITDNFPIRSITELNKPFKKKFFEINGKMMSLNDVEEIIASYDDARLLIVINRNSISGVRLIKKAYTDLNLNDLLDKRIRLFLKNPNKNLISDSEAKLSPLFKKYEKEIIASFGSLKSFISLYHEKPLKEQKISYMKFEEKINSYQAYEE